MVGKAGAMGYIRRVGCIQFDPLNIVGRNPDLVLQARISGYRPRLLEGLLYEDRRLLDGWDKNMSIYAVEDWPYFYRRREVASQDYGESSRPALAILPEVREAIEERGPLSSIDLRFDETVGWSWAPTRMARAALESMYHWGELIVHHKVNTRKVYYFAGRHLPPDLMSASDPNETAEQYHDWHVLRRIGSVGMLSDRAGDAWLAMFGSRERKQAVIRLLKRGEVFDVRVEGIGQPLYVRTVDRESFERSLRGEDMPPRAVLLAPLDNLLWDRRLVRELFGFSYVWEVYKPAAERIYGYYVIPVLFGDRFVARFDPGRDKGSGALIINNWWWEPDVTPSKAMRSALIDCFGRFLDYLGAAELRIESAAAPQAGLEWLAAVGR